MFCGTAWLSANFLCHGRVQSDIIQENTGLELLGGPPLWPSRPNLNAHPAGRAHFISSMCWAKQEPSRWRRQILDSKTALSSQGRRILTLKIELLLFSALNSAKDSHTAPKHPWALPPSPSHPLTPSYLMFQHFLLFHISMPCSPWFLHWESPLLLPTGLIPMQSSLLPILHTPPSWPFNYQDMVSQGYDRAWT